VKFVKHLLVLVLLASPAFCRSKLQGWCEAGNVSVSIAGTIGSGSQKFQQSYPSCTVTVYATATVNMINIYADNNGTVKANPFTASSDGTWFFYADNQRVDVKFSGGGISSPFTLSDFMLSDAAQLTTTLNAMAFNATPTFAAATNSIFTMTLTGNVTASTITGSSSGQIIEFSLCQDGTGGRTFAWPASFLRPPTIASGANACTDASFFYDGTNWRDFGATGDTLAPTTAGISGSWAGTPTWTGAHTFSGGGSLSGTFSGNPTWSGNHTFSGTATFNGSLSATSTASFKYLEGFRWSDQFPQGTAALRQDGAATDCGTTIGCFIGTSTAESSGVGSGSSQTNTNISWLDQRTGSLSNPTANRNWTHPGFKYVLYDNSAQTTDANAQSDANAAPAVMLQSVESGGAVAPPLYLYGVGIKGSTAVQYSLLGKTQVYPGWRGATVANNIVTGLNAAYDITNIVEASAGQIVATVSDTSTPSIFGGATTHNCQIGDVAHISGVTDTYYNTAAVGYSVTAVGASTVTMSIGAATHAASSGGKILCKNYQTFAWESNVFNNDVNQNQDLTPTMEQNLNATWGHVVTSSGTFPITGANFVAGRNQYYGGVVEDATVAAERLGYYKSGQPTLTMSYGVLHDQRNIATAGNNYASVPAGFHGSYWNGASATDAWVSENAVPDAGASPIVRHTFGYCTGSYNCSPATIFSINSDGTNTSYGAVLPSAVNSWAIGSTALPWKSVIIGAAATNNITLTGTATAGRTATLPDATGSVLVTGNGSSQIQTKRAAGCATAATLNATCDTTITWTTAFADANYTVTCSGNQITSNLPVIQAVSASASKTASAVTVRTLALTAAAAQFTNIECTAVHD
jgi:predicted aconitase with swiveling domain